MSKKGKKRSMIATLAVFTAVVGAGVAIGAFLKKRAKTIGEQLDYDGSLYYEDDDYLDEDDVENNCPEEPEETAESSADLNVEEDAEEQDESRE